MSDLAHQLEGYRYDLSSEDAVQRGLAVALGEIGVPAAREVQVDCGRLDFLTADGTAIEVKLHGSTNDLLRQLSRYAQLEQVKGLLVVTTRHRLAQLPAELGGKPLSVALLVGSFL
jgi:hypothetical protein